MSGRVANEPVSLAGSPPGESQAAAPADAGLSALASLVQALQGGTLHIDWQRAEAETAFENRLAAARLGIAASLFASLRARHAPTATHCLRVALGCSTWAWAIQMPPAERDALELAALLHDIGKLAVPDSVLLKPGRLTGSEVIVMERQTQFGLEILGHCCPEGPVLDLVKHTPAWFNGAKHGFAKKGAELPLGSRMLAIIDAFDSMTTDHVYRQALPRERAVAEMFEFAGTQFDPALVRQFCELLMADWSGLQQRVTRQWLRELVPAAANSVWQASTPATIPAAPTVERMFHDRLLESMHDGVVFVDSDMRIQMWNRGAERITGLPPASVVRNRWLPSLTGLRDEKGNPISDDECPVQYAIRSGVQTIRRLGMAGRNGSEIHVDFHVVPVIGAGGAAHGATLVLHDASSEATLEQHVLSLYERATHDPLTKVANRAEFDRVHALFIETHLERHLPCSLIICDIDHFKRINDNYGHQAGDEALVSFAALLKRHCRTGDLAARYGGEEFVLLLADCPVTSAATRAEDLRRELAQLAQPALRGQAITASFGVTELQPGDTPDTMLCRADRALLQAKDEGRNRVVQLGAGGAVAETKPRESWWQRLWSSRSPECLLKRRLVTPVPLHLAVQKLRGFVSDHRAELVRVEGGELVIEVTEMNAALLRRTNDRSVPFTIELKLYNSQDSREGPMLDPRRGDQTLIDVVIYPRRSRDRRRSHALDRAKQLFVSLKSYLMAHELSEQRPETGGREGHA